jgi:DNA-binding IclR family transcriptional regulator
VSHAPPTPPPIPSPPAQRGIQSIEVGGALLQALVHHGRPLPLKELAAGAGMAPAKAHPYLVSFGKLGLIEQDAASGHYGLGPLALQLGLISLQQFDPVALATPVIDRMAADCGHTFALSVWGDRGATIVRVAWPPGAVVVSMRHGTVMGLRATASGRLFAAHLPRAQVLPVLKAEDRAEGRRPPGFDRNLDTELDGVRVQGLATVQDRSLPGIAAMAAPVFDNGGRLVLALTAIGPTPALDLKPQGRLAQRVRAEAAALSARLGWRAAA